MLPSDSRRLRPPPRNGLSGIGLDCGDFLKFWNTVAKRTRYLVEFDTENLIQACIESIANMSKIYPPQIKVEIAQIEQTHAGVREQTPHSMQWIDGTTPLVLPDIVTMIQSETNLTRRTISRILAESGKLDEFAVNPQAYITAVTAIVREKLNTCLMDGLRYELLEDDVWQVREFSRNSASAIDDDRLFAPTNGQNRTVFDRIPTDSGTELEFVKHLDIDDRVKYYVKLPDWFKIDTPIGTYNPDWAIMFEGQRTFYLIRETKSTTLESARRGTENAKIHAARAHYRAIDVGYEVATSWSEVLRSLPAD